MEDVRVLRLFPEQRERIERGAEIEGADKVGAFQKLDGRLAIFFVEG